MTYKKKKGKKNEIITGEKNLKTKWSLSNKDKHIKYKNESKIFSQIMDKQKILTVLKDWKKKKHLETKKKLRSSPPAAADTARMYNFLYRPNVVRNECECIKCIRCSNITKKSRRRRRRKKKLYTI